ncbi:hypothetical protein DUI87_03622 [Hirundo rustica rustica]|uniref:Reverse transcriptase domain-containing protein n=1 Tax=Hirundo rustica rustica TaxID=333673 RepID=A0A3M0L0P4_HIRRU|nr:hypothetical protein DUI87_03622 [Hirundo rustica rustica]
MENREGTQESHHGFTKRKFCLTSILVFYNGVTPSVDKGKVTSIIYQDLWKAFDMVPYNILLSKLERNGFVGQGCLRQAEVAVPEKPQRLDPGSPKIQQDSEENSEFLDTPTDGRIPRTRLLR